MKKMTIYIIIAVAVLILIGGYFWYNQDMKITNEQVSYSINGKDVNQKEFEELKSQLNISAKPVGGETVITPEGSDSGSEEHYDAVNTKTGEKYSYSIRFVADNPVEYQSLILSTEPKITEYRDFSCPGMTGFTFKYPVFEGWEPADLKSTGQSECTIHLSSEALVANNINTEVSPQVKIKQIHIASLPNLTKAPDFLGLNETNTNGIRFTKTDDGHYDFWIGDSIVSVALWSAGGYGFSVDHFFQTVIESFRLAE